MKFCESESQLVEFYNGLITLSSTSMAPAEAKEQAGLLFGLCQVRHWDLVKDIEVPPFVNYMSRCITKHEDEADKVDVKRSKMDKSYANYISNIEASDFEGDFISLATLAVAYAYATRTRSVALGLKDVMEDATKLVKDEDLQARLADCKNNPKFSTFVKPVDNALELIREMFLPQRASCSM